MTTVHILLATYNGELFLKEQLESIKNQTYKNWTLTISDDGSTDNTLNIISQFSNDVEQKVKLLPGKGPGLGPTSNFFRLIQSATITSSKDLYSFCDQDDVWFANKLIRAVQWHDSACTNQMRLYCSRTIFVDEQLRQCGMSPNLYRQPSFGNALVQNIASGNTMVISATAMAVLKKIKPEHSVWHDWTTYLATTAVGGSVQFDIVPSLLYRQHSSNVIGSNSGVKAKITRLIPLINGRFRSWSDKNNNAILDIRTQLCPNAIKTFSDFMIIRHSRNYIDRLCTLRNSTIRRQGILSNINLSIAVLLRLI